MSGLAREDRPLARAYQPPAPPGLVRSWYLPLLAGVLPALVLGFGYSALADRIVFVVWGAATAGVWVVLLRYGLLAGWSPARRWATLLIAASTGLITFADLERGHHEILDLGFRAVLPGLYREAATRPSTALLAAGLTGLAGLIALLLSARGTQGKPA